MQPALFDWFTVTESLRLAKYLAAQQACSRREAENYISGGWVRVDGVVVEEPGFKIEPGHIVTLAPGATSADFKPVTLLLNKPVGSGASASDGSAADLLIIANRAAGDHTGMPVLRKHFARLELAAGLETEASGLIVATQDFRIVRKLLGEADKVEMEYVVEVSGALTDDGLKKMNRPWTVDGQSFPAAKVSWQSETRLRVALKTPPAGFIAYMCEEAGLTVLSMKRIRIGRLPMGSLPLGQWRYLLGYERF